jgi:hypothetical protein
LSVPPSASYARLQARIIEYDLVALAARLRRRQMLRRLDTAIEKCELLNRDVGTDAAVPEEVAALIAELQEPPGCPTDTSLEALNELFRLQRPYMNTTWYVGDDVEVLDGAVGAPTPAMRAASR